MSKTKLLHLLSCGKMKVLNGSVGLGLCGDRRRRDALLLHPVGLGTDDEAEKVLVRNGWS